MLEYYEVFVFRQKKCICFGSTADIHFAYKLLYLYIMCYINTPTYECAHTMNIVVVVGWFSNQIQMHRIKNGNDHIIMSARGIRKSCLRRYTVLVHTARNAHVRLLYPIHKDGSYVILSKVMFEENTVHLCVLCYNVRRVCVCICKYDVYVCARSSSLSLIWYMGAEGGFRVVFEYERWIFMGLCSMFCILSSARAHIM